MKLQLQGSCLDDWFVLGGGGNWACVEGTAEQWSALAGAIERGEACVFKRCATKPEGDEVTFWSPRNAYQDRDIVRMPKVDAPALARHIRRVLAAYSDGEPTTEDER